MDPPTQLPVHRSLSNPAAENSESSPVPPSPIPDEHIMLTNEEATLCKLDAIKMGYWKDPYLPQFVHGSFRHERKAPDMYKGYYARVKCVERLVLDFVHAVIKDNKAEIPVVQIVNLGAGYDTLYWRLKSNEKLCNQVRIKVVDLDLLPVTIKKYHAIKTHKQLSSLLTGEWKEGELPQGELHTGDYDLISADIRDTLNIERKLMAACKLDPKRPTLFIAECVLIYMNTGSTKQLLTWIAETFETACFINYEQVNMSDNFGQIMYNSLKEQGCVLADADSCKSLKFHEERFVKTGWTKASAADMNAMCSSLPRAEIERIDRIAMIDEPDVLQQLFNHYCIAWAYKGAVGTELEKVRLL
ncbi:leucine carboxyl methyltransferase 1-like [Paramacrobiotus metropolitanus]|uniref:leucine carboxyl methyltransferase 1-like n=1 Tax=Paramacrobiotus metropolitanus TaxID=2943436 RepID=UPI00244596C8|nr:leucine carboxyl methyltransferase 1-like [Paramacrobiotus metropolitanus]